MKIFKGACEIAFSREDVEAAMRLWLTDRTRLYDGEFTITNMTLHPGNKYVMRVTVEPPPATEKPCARSAVEGSTKPEDVNT